MSVAASVQTGVERGFALPLARWEDIGFRPNDWAVWPIHAGPERFRALVATRQCGKSHEAGAWIDKQMMYPHDGKPAWVGVGSYDYDHAEMLVAKWWDLHL